MMLTPAFTNAAAGLTGCVVIAAAGCVSAQGCAAAVKAPAAAGVPDAPAGYPTFCSIPKPPTDVRSVGSFRSAIVDTRLAGRTATRESGPDTWTLPENGAGDFAATARAEAAPPPAQTHGAEADAKAYADELRRLATPPRPR